MEEKKLTILIDMDDTIECLLVEWIDWLNEQYGTNVQEDDIHDYDVSLAFPTLTKAQVFEPLMHRELWHRVKPKTGARYALERLVNDGHDVYIVTSSNFHTIESKLNDVLFMYFPYIDPAHVIVARNKQMIRGDIMIDDAPHNLVGGDYLKIMPTAPHNREFDAKANGIIRADTWDEIYNIVNDYWKLTQGIEDVKHEELGELVYVSWEGACKLLHMKPETLVHQIERWNSELAFM